MRSPRALSPLVCLLLLGAAACVHETVIGPVGTDDDAAGALVACEARDRVIDDDLDIPQGFGCHFIGVEIRGNLTVARGAHLSAVDLIVHGDLDARYAARLAISGGYVDGNVRFERGHEVEIRDTRIDGDLRFRSNAGSVLARGNVIEGNLEVRSNRKGPVTLSSNTVHGDLDCRDNDPAPEGSGNRIFGDAERQCRHF